MATVDLNTSEEQQVDLNTNEEQQVDLNTSKELQVGLNTIKELQVDLNTSMKQQVDRNTSEEQQVDLNTSKELQVDLNTSMELQVNLNTSKELQIDLNTSKEQQVDLNTSKELQIDLNTSKEQQVDLNINEEQQPKPEVTETQDVTLASAPFAEPRMEKKVVVETKDTDQPIEAHLNGDTSTRQTDIETSGIGMTAVGSSPPRIRATPEKKKKRTGKSSGSNIGPAPVSPAGPEKAGNQRVKVREPRNPVVVKCEECGSGLAGYYALAGHTFQHSFQLGARIMRGRYR